MILQFIGGAVGCAQKRPGGKWHRGSSTASTSTGLRAQTLLFGGIYDRGSVSIWPMGDALFFDFRSSTLSPIGGS